MKQLICKFLFVCLALIPSVGSAQTVSTITGKNWSQMTVNPVTGKVYLLSWISGAITVLDGTTNSAVATIPVSTIFGQGIAINPATNKLYVAGGFSNDVVTVVDCATNTTSTIPVGKTPEYIAVNPVTNTIYVLNTHSDDVTVINGATNTTSTVPAGDWPTLARVNSTTNKIYLVDEDDNILTTIDGASNTTTSQTLPSTPGYITVNSVTNKIYVGQGQTVSVIDGLTNSVSSIPISNGPADVNPFTNKVYVGGINGVNVIDGNTNKTSFLPGGGNPIAMSVNQVTNKIYSAYSGGINIIDGSSNSSTQLSLAASSYYLMATNPATSKTYLIDSIGNLTIISDLQVQPSTLTTSINPLTANQTSSPTPAFTFTATSTTASQPSQVYFQVDTWQNAWTAATGNASTFAGTTVPLQPGFHMLYAYALSGQQGATAPVGSPAAANIQAYGFLVVPGTQTSLPPPATSAVPFLTTQTPGVLRNNYSGFVGFEFTVGSTPVQVSSLGRYLAPGNSGSHLLKIVQSSGVDVPNGSVSLAISGTAGQYQYAALAIPVTLAANTSYYLVSQETAGGDQWYDIGSVSSTSDAAVLAPVYSYGQNSYYAVPGYAGKSYVPVNFLYSSATATAALTVNITSPQSGATLSGSVLVTVATTGSVANLQLQVDGVNQGAGSVLTLNTALLGNGFHTLTVVASDAQGNSVTSSGVAITVSNGSTVATPTGAAFLTAQSPGALRNNYSGFAGFAFTTGSSSVTVSSLGRYVAPSNSGIHIVKLVSGDGTDVVGGSVSISLAGTTAGQYAYASLASSVTLQANTTYYLVSQETAGGDQWYDIGTVTSSGAASVTAPVYSYGPTSYYPVPGYAGKSYVPVNFLYGTGTVAPTATLTAGITSPQSGSTVSGSIQVTTTTTGPVANLQLQVDGTNLGAANILSLNTASLTNGSHTLTVIASDAQGNSVTSAGVTINVSNAPAHGGNAFVTAQSPGALRNNFSGFVGLAFTTGSSPVLVSSLGRYVISGNFNRHVLKLVDSTGNDVPGGSVSFLPGGGITGWEYFTLDVSITLPPNTSYYLLSQETAGGDYWYDIGSVTTTAVARVSAPTYGGTNGNYYPVAGLAGQSYGPVSFLYQISTAPLAVGITSPANGAMFAAGTPVSVAFSASASASTFQLQVDGVNTGAAVSASLLTLDTSALSTGSHSVSVVASNGQTTATSAAITITITAAAAPSASAPFITGETLSTLRNNYTGYVGMAFRVGSQPLTVTGLGSLSVTASATASPLAVKLVNANGTDVNGGSVSLRPGLGTNGQFNYVLLTQSVTLAANTTYILVSQETAGGSNWYDLGPVSSTSAAQVVGPVYTDSQGNYTIVSGLANYSYVPVSFLYH